VSVTTLTGEQNLTKERIPGGIRREVPIRANHRQAVQMILKINKDVTGFSIRSKKTTSIVNVFGNG